MPEFSSLPAPPVGRSSVPPASDRVAVVVNGNAKSVTDEVIATLDQILIGGDLFVSRRLEEGPGIARTIISRGYGTVLTGGGDGTFTVMVSEVVREARAQGRPLPRFGLLRLGTGNALAWVVGASAAKGRGLAADIQRLQQDAGSRPLRLIEVEGFLAPFCGFGIDADVLNDYSLTKQRLAGTPLRRFGTGLLGYSVSSVTRTIPSYLLRKGAHCRVVNRGAEAYRLGDKGAVLGAPIAPGEVLYEGPARIGSMGTIPYFGFGFRALPYAEERPDRMHLRISKLSPFDFLANLPAIWTGTWHDPAILFDYLVEEVEIELDPATVFQVGGDPCGEKTTVHARLAREPIQLVDFYAPPRGK